MIVSKQIIQMIKSISWSLVLILGLVFTFAIAGSWKPPVQQETIKVMTWNIWGRLNMEP
jgi:hypothetical protein